MKVYLAGPLTGVKYKNVLPWRETATAHLDDVSNGLIKSYSPLRGADFIEPDAPMQNVYKNFLGTQRSITYLDRHDVFSADLVLANMLLAEKASIGTVMELAWANARDIPIVLIMEAGGNPHDHGMIREICPMRVQTLEEGLLLVTRILLP
jgi:nucleoside 2-deoxyribosyltransferase